MFTKLFIVALAVLVLQVSCLPSRVKRQGFSWGDDDDFVTVPSRRPTRPTPPASSPTPSSGDGTTTTTAAPQFTNCMRNCPITPQYNPVCGSNRVTYENESRLRCAQRCGLTVEVAFGGSCSPL